MKRSLWVLFILAVSCSTPKVERVDPDRQFTVYDSFRFRLAMDGKWDPVQPRTGFFVFKKRLDNAPDVSIIAEVRGGPMVFGQFPPRNNKEILGELKKELAAATLSARLKNVKSQYNEVIFKGAECVTFHQVGEAHNEKNTQRDFMKLTFEGITCLHPNKPERYVRMSVSQRVPNTQKASDLSKDLKSFIDTLEFL